MAAGRARTVLSPEPPPRKRKPAADKPEAPEWKPRPGAPTVRVRPTLRDPFDELPRPSYHHTEAEAQEQFEADEAAGLAPVIEYLTRAIWAPPPREVPTVHELAMQGLARELPTGHFWISPEGTRVLHEAMVGP